MMREASPTVPAAALHEFAAAVLGRARLPPQDAEGVAESLVDADLRGVHSHGVARLGIYVERLRAGGNRAVGEVRVVAERDALAILDAGGLLSQVASRRGVEIAVEKARAHGCATVLVRGGSHFGAAGYWARLIAEQGLVGMAATNTSPLMAAFGGAGPVIGTNPLALAFPSAGSAPVVVDLATSETTWGALLQAQLAARAIPDTWALGHDGTPTVDPDEAIEARSLLAFGRHKGYALAVGIELLTGVLAGARFLAEIPDMYAAPDVPQALGHVFVAIDVTALDAEGSRLPTAVARVQAELNSATAQPGVERVLWPGQLEAETAERRRADGIPLPPLVLRQLDELAEAMDVEPAW